MKLIIDIDDNDYGFIKDLHSLIIGGRGNCKTIQYNVINAVKNGKPISNDGDLISRSALKEKFLKYKPYAVDFLSLIDNAPTVEFSKEICSACGRYIREKGGAE